MAKYAPQWAQKPDANQPEIVTALEKIGCIVLDLHRVGGGCPDILVWRNGKCCLLEIKFLKAKLNKLQREFHAVWTGCTFTVRSPEEAIAAVPTFTNG